MSDDDAVETRRNASGQSMRRKGQQTRQRLVEATVELLKTESLTTLRPGDIAALAGTSKPNFYLYFPTVVDAALAAVENDSMDTEALVALLDKPWPDELVVKRAREFVSAYFKRWAEHSHVLRVRRAMVGEGDARFVEAEATAIIPLVAALAAKIRAAQRLHPNLRDLHAQSAAGALASMLERLAGRGPMEANNFGVTNERIVSAIAVMIANLLVPTPGE